MISVFAYLYPSGIGSKIKSRVFGRYPALNGCAGGLNVFLNQIQTGQCMSLGQFDLRLNQVHAVMMRNDRLSLALRRQSHADIQLHAQLSVGICAVCAPVSILFCCLMLNFEHFSRNRSKADWPRRYLHLQSNLVAFAILLYFHGDKD